LNQLHQLEELTSARHLFASERGCRLSSFKGRALLDLTLDREHLTMSCSRLFCRRQIIDDTLMFILESKSPSGAEESGPRIGNLRTLIEMCPELILLDIAFLLLGVPRTVSVKVILPIIPISDPAAATVSWSSLGLLWMVRQLCAGVCQSSRSPGEALRR